MPHTENSDASFAWLRGLVDELPGAAYRCRNDDERTVEFISAGCRQLTGLGPERFVGEANHGLCRIMLTEDALVTRRVLQESLADGEPFEHTYRIRRADGMVRWLLERGRGVFLPDGTVVATEGFLTDVTGLHAAQMQVAEKERLVHAIFEQTSQFIGLLDRAGRVLRANRASLAAIGVRTEDVVGRSFCDAAWWRHSPEVQQRVRDAVERAAAGEIVHFEAELIAPGGARACMDFTLSPVRDEHGKVVALIPEGHDITERSMAEHAFRALLEGTAGETGQAFFEATVARLARELGVRAALVAEIDSARGQTWMRCLARWADGPVGRCEGDVAGTAFEQVLTHPVVHVERGVVQRFPGDVLTEEVNGEGFLAMPVLDRAGGVLGLVAVFDDKPMPGSDAARLVVAASAARAAVEIQHRRSDEAIHRLNLQLEQRVAERTAQLAAANSELESFSYSVSHDLRSPLRAVDGFSRALEEDFGAMLNDEGRNFLQRIRAASQRMGLLIDDLLRLSRATRVEMKRERVDLSEVAHTIVGELRRRDPEREVRFTCESGLVVTADRALVGILLENLVDNAWKYTRRTEGAHIRFGRAPQPAAEPDGAEVLMVADNGAGFDMRYVGKLFAPFQRLHGPSEFEGTGIGLATVRRIAVRHGGRAWIEGAPGHGATVYFTLGPVRV